MMVNVDELRELLQAAIDELPKVEAGDLMAALEVMGRLTIAHRQACALANRIEYAREVGQ